jgi:hypothetical protein
LLPPYSGRFSDTRRKSCSVLTMPKRIERKDRLRRQDHQAKVEQQSKQLEVRRGPPIPAGRAASSQISSRDPMIPVTPMQVPAAPHATDTAYVSSIPSYSFSFHRPKTGERILEFRSPESYTSRTLPSYRIQPPERMARTNPVRGLASATWLYPFKVGELRCVTGCA